MKAKRHRFEPGEYRYDFYGDTRSFKVICPDSYNQIGPAVECWSGYKHYRAQFAVADGIILVHCYKDGKPLQYPFNPIETPM